MNSKGLSKYGLINWLSFDLDKFEHFREQLPKKCGVYVFRYYCSFRRLRGKSDILYIGSSIGEMGLRVRFRSYAKPGVTQETSKRINRLLKRYPKTQIAFVTKGKKDWRKFESSLLEIYASDHDELPPWNRKG